MPGVITFHFDGPMVVDHQITLRTLGNTLTNLQSAIDRAYLDVRYGQVWKNAHLKNADYPETEFIVGVPRDGGYILDLQRQIQGSAIVRRISAAVRAVHEAPWQDGAREAERLAEQSMQRSGALRQGVFQGRTLQQFVADPQNNALRRYGDRAIAKEIDQVLVPLRRPQEEGEDRENTLELMFNFGRDETRFEFDRESATEFHGKVSQRELGEPLRYTGTLRSIDRGRNERFPKARLTLENNQRDVTLHIRDQVAYQQLAPFMQGNQQVSLYAAPVLEFGAYDPNGGDVYFIGLVGEN